MMLAALLLASGFIGVTAASASAGVQATIDVQKACQIKGYLGASFWNTGPYGWYCYSFSIPPTTMYTAAVDMQNYCTRYWPGSRAIIVNWNLYGWKCDGVRV